MFSNLLTGQHKDNSWERVSHRKGFEFRILDLGFWVFFNYYNKSDYLKWTLEKHGESLNISGWVTQKNDSTCRTQRVLSETALPLQSQLPAVTKSRPHTWKNQEVVTCTWRNQNIDEDFVSCVTHRVPYSLYILLFLD